MSGKTGYQWLSRYQAAGPGGLAQRWRAPHVVPWAVTEAQAEAIFGLRGQHPSWGPNKLRAKLLARAPQQHWPALSTIGDLFAPRGTQPAAQTAAASHPDAERGASDCGAQ